MTLLACGAAPVTVYRRPDPIPLHRARPAADFALEHFVYRIGLNTGMLAASLGGLDAFVFTAGIGENSPTMRARIAVRLEWLGAKLDPDSNACGDLVISTPDSKLKLLVVPTDEELMIARHTLSLIRA